MAKTVSMELPHPSQADDRGLRAELPLKVLAAYAAAAIVAILLVSLPFATDYVGADNDDVMRLVVVRDLLAGQSWFDPTQYRLGLEGGTLMHWSRLVDLPIANLIDIFSVFADRERAEALSLAVWPLALTVPLLYGMGLAGLRLGGPTTMHVALILSTIFVVSINRFQPGSIDHHNAQLALIAVVAAMLLDGRFRARSFAVAGAGCALAIAIGAETTPLVAVVCLLVALKWAWHGEPFLRAACAFGLALALVTTLAFFGTIAPAHYRQVTCDNLSYGFYALATFGGAALFLVATQTSHLERGGRFVALLVAGAVLAAATLAIAPGCLQNPLNELDPLLKTFWLSGVIEAQSITTQFSIDPGSIGGFYAVAVLALIVCAVRVVRGEEIEAHATLMAMIGCAFAIALMQVRGSAFSNLLAVIPLAMAIADLRRLANANPKNLRLGIAFAGLTIASVPPAWAIAGLAVPGMSRERLLANLGPARAKPSCTSPRAMAELAREPAGVVAGSPDLGATILRYTNHRALAGPYHRNQGGMLTELHIGLAPPKQAEAFLRGAGVTLLAFCPSDMQLRGVAKAAPQGLYARLLAGDVPPYLERSDSSDTALAIFRIRPEGK